MAVKCPKCNFENPADTKFCSECAAPLHPSEKISAPLTETLETPKEELTTGSVFAGRYQIIEVLGKGGMGKVYRALDKKLNEEVALKLVKPEIASDKKTLERFSNELKIARKIAHKNVGRMYELMEEKGTHFITMEYVPGEDLKSFIKRAGPLSAGKTTFIAKQVCEGLAEAHGLGVVHRDLKPQNIMIDKEGNSRIMDFGIARSLTAKGITDAGVMIGTPEYMSPEQVEGKEADQRSDIYSLGVILYEMVTGRVPFEGDTPLSVAVKQKTEAPEDPKKLNSQIPEDLSKVILRCLEKDKAKRYQSAGEVQAEVDKIEKGIPTTERIVPERKPITSREITVTFGLKKLFIPALVVVAVVIAAVIIWRLLPRKETALAPKIENSIAVISFENQTGDKGYDYLQKVIPNLLITNLENTGLHYVVTWERMHDLLKQIGKNDVEIIDRDLGFDVCRLEGIEAIVLGFFTKAGDVFHTDIKVLDTETKKILKSYISKGEGVDSILKTQIDELSREISEGLGIARQKIELTGAQITDVTTSSMEAYNYYIRGKDDFEKFYWEEAGRFLKKATELDPTFASAYLYLFYTYDRLENAKAANEALKKAKSLFKKATEKENLYIDATYAFSIERNQEEYIRILNKMAEKYPKEKQVHSWLGYYYHGAQNLNEAIVEYNKALELDPDYGIILNQLGYIYTQLREYERAKEYFQRYASLSPGDANPLDSMADMYFFQGRLDDAIAKYKEALEVEPDFLSRGKIGYVYALMENYSEALRMIELYTAEASTPGVEADGHLLKGFHYFWLGRYKEALINLQKAAELAKSTENKDQEALAHWIKGWMHYDRGEFDLCWKEFDLDVEGVPQWTPYFKAVKSYSLGLVNLKVGKIEDAKSRLAEIESYLKMVGYSDDWIKSRYDLLLGEVLLAEGLIEKAVTNCENISFSNRPPAPHFTELLICYNVPFLKDVLAKAYLKNGDLDKAISEYEKLIIFDPEKEGRFLLHPKYHYRLAKLYEQKGQKDKAIEHYERFLELWKDADPGIEEVKDARERLTGLLTK
jgi:serine/threonine protein kinase/Flp pilus assembly protein TadD